MGYQYPMREDWSTEELITVITLFEHIEKAYETAVTSEDVLNAYKEFKKVVPAMAEEKRLFKEFEKSSTYNSYQVVQRAKKKSESITMS